MHLHTKREKKRQKNVYEPHKVAYYLFTMMIIKGMINANDYI